MVVTASQKGPRDVSRTAAVREGAEALHAGWEPEEAMCDGRCFNDAELVIDSLYRAGYEIVKRHA